MVASAERQVQANFRCTVPSKWPIAAPLVLMAVALAFRALDIFVLRLDEQIGEIILSKSLGFALVAVYIWWVGETLAAIGLHGRGLVAALSIGVCLTGVAFAVAGIIQAVSLAAGDHLTLVASDPKTGMAGGAGFAALLIVGNVINAFMEEGLFRGIMLPHFLQRFRFPVANVLQATLFSAWHLVWPLKSYLTGGVSLTGALARGGLLILGTFVAGIIYGYLFWHTDSLWAPWAAHFVNNTILNLLQVRSAGGDLQPAMLLSVVVVVILALLMVALRPIARRLQLPHLKPWGMSIESAIAL